MNFIHRNANIYARDLKEVVREIRDEFETASNHGKEVVFLFEIYKPPYE